jgi:hypothetical protein
MSASYILYIVPGGHLHVLVSILPSILTLNFWPVRYSARRRIIEPCFPTVYNFYHSCGPDCVMCFGYIEYGCSVCPFIELVSHMFIEA